MGYNWYATVLIPEAPIAQPLEDTEVGDDLNDAYGRMQGLGQVYAVCNQRIPPGKVAC